MTLTGILAVGCFLLAAQIVVGLFFVRRSIQMVEQQIEKHISQNKEDIIHVYARAVEAAALYRDTERNNLERIIEDGDVLKVIEVKQRIRRVENRGAKTVTEYQYREDGKIQSETRINDELRYKISYAADGVPEVGVAFCSIQDGAGKKPKAVEFAYDKSGQVVSRKELEF